MFFFFVFYDPTILLRTTFPLYYLISIIDKPGKQIFFFSNRIFSIIVVFSFQNVQRLDEISFMVSRGLGSGRQVVLVSDALTEGGRKIFHLQESSYIIQICLRIIKPLTNDIIFL